MANERWTDQKIEVIVGDLLRAGVLLSAFIVLSGGLLYLARYGGQHSDFRAFRGEPSALRSVGGIGRQALGLHARGLIQFGLLLLIATPVARVIFAIFGFAKEQDRMYVIIASIVLVILLYSLIGSALIG